jgi:asparaginyl-tRNA synthetase
VYFLNLLQKYEPAAKSQLKKIQKIWIREGYKGAEKLKKEDDDAVKRAKNLEEAKRILIKEDVSLPIAELIKIVDGKENRGVRVKVNGWVHRLRRQGITSFYNLLTFVGFLVTVI